MTLPIHSFPADSNLAEVYTRIRQRAGEHIVRSVAVGAAPFSIAPRPTISPVPAERSPDASPTGSSHPAAAFRRPEPTPVGRSTAQAPAITPAPAFTIAAGQPTEPEVRVPRTVWLQRLTRLTPTAPEAAGGAHSDRASSAPALSSRLPAASEATSATRHPAARLAHSVSQSNLRTSVHVDARVATSTVVRDRVRAIDGQSAAFEASKATASSLSLT